jgi:hypothetical protein
VELMVNNSSVERLSAPARFFSFSGVNLVPGQNTVTAITTDTLGNVASTTVVVELAESRPARWKFFRRPSRLSVGDPI